MPETKTYAVKMTAMEMFYVRKAVNAQVMTLLDEIHNLRLMDPADVQDFDHIEEALTRKTVQMERLESALDKMLEAGANNENPYL